VKAADDPIAIFKASLSPNARAVFEAGPDALDVQKLAHAERAVEEARRDLAAARKRARRNAR
jgi:hypothetical protein